MLTNDPGVGRRSFTRIIADHMVVIDVDRMEMRILDPSASVLWLLPEEGGRTSDGITAALAEVFRETVGTVTEGVAARLAEWRDLGWIETCLATSALGLTGRSVPVIRRDGVFRVGDGEAPPVCAATEIRVGMTDADVRICIGQTEESPFADLIARLLGMLSGFPPQTQADRPPGACLSFFAAQERIWIGAPDGWVWADDPSKALSHLMLHIMLAGSPTTTPLPATVHAAAMGRGGGLILMPGLSGKGKSTLTAYLAAHGWLYAGDDVVGLGATEAGDPVVTPFPTAISLKPGSRPILTEYYPQISDLPTLSYAGKQARFLAWPHSSVVGRPQEQRRLRAVVFPRYAPQGACELQKISTLDCLFELIAAGFTAGDKLEPARLERFFDFLEVTPKYRLTYPCLQQAERCLASLPA
jgi:hypothetical protein